MLGWVVKHLFQPDLFGNGREGEGLVREVRRNFYLMDRLIMLADNSCGCCEDYLHMMCLTHVKRSLGLYSMI